MRYLSLAIIVGFAAFTWHLSRIEAHIPVAIHHDIQMDMAKIITAAIQNQLPNAKDIKFKSLYSKPVNEDEVNVYFDYTFEDHQSGQEPTTTGINGTAIVKRNPNQQGTWVLESIQLSGSTIEFKDGIVVTREGVFESTDEVQ